MAIVKPLETKAGARRRLSISSPANLEEIGEIEVQTPEDVRAAVAKARQAQKSWGALSFDERGKYMMRALSVLLERQDEFIKAIQRDTPKPCADTMQMDIFAVCDALHYYAKRTSKILRTEKKSLHGVMALSKQLRIVYRPVGVVGVISPWNAFDQVVYSATSSGVPHCMKCWRG